MVWENAFKGNHTLDLLDRFYSDFLCIFFISAVFCAMICQKTNSCLESVVHI